MSDEGGGSASVGIGIGLFIYFKPAPSLGILKFWQGIVEVATRVAILVSLKGGRRGRSQVYLCSTFR